MVNLIEKDYTNITKEVQKMIIFSTAKLSKTIKTKRKEKGLTQRQLSELAGIKSIMICRIEREAFIPSITQLEALAKVFDFEITDMFLYKQEATSFIALRNQILSDNEPLFLTQFYFIALLKITFVYI